MGLRCERRTIDWHGHKMVGGASLRSLDWTRVAVMCLALTRDVYQGQLLRNRGNANQADERDGEEGGGVSRCEQTSGDPRRRLIVWCWNTGERDGGEGRRTVGIDEPKIDRMGCCKRDYDKQPPEA